MTKALVTLSGRRVVAATITLPRVGVWHADVSVDLAEGEAVPTGAVVLSVGARRWVGTVRRGDEWRGVARVRVVGGQGGLGAVLEPAHFRGAPGRLVAHSLLERAGEALSSASDPAVLSRELTSWTTPRGTAGEALSALSAELGVTWRVLADGTVWLGGETWAAHVPARDVVITARWPEDGGIELADDELGIEPGVTVFGSRVGRVVHRVETGSVRTEAWFDDRGTATDSVKHSLARLARAAVGVDTLAAYKARIVQQHADLTLDLKPYDERLPGLTEVPIRTALPGLEVRVASGGDVLVEFEGGNASKPMATLFSAGQLDAVVLRAADGVRIFAPLVELGAAGGRPVARQGDMVACGGALPTPCLVTLGAPGVPGAPVLLGVPTPATLQFLVTPLYGQIKSGNQKVKA